MRNVSLLRLLFRYYGATLAGLSVSSLYSVVDRIFIGRYVGGLALSAVGACYPVHLLVMALGMLVGIGGSVRISIALGGGRVDAAERIVGHGVWLMVVVGLSVMVVFYANPLGVVGLLGTRGASSDYALEYLQITLLSTVFNVVGHSGNGYIRSQGHVRFAMVSVLVAGVLNIVLDWLLIGIWGLGVRGAAWATVVSQVCLGVSVVVFLSGPVARAPLRLRYVRWDGGLARGIVSVGVSPFLMQLCSTLSFGLLNVALLRWGGAVAVSVMAVVQSVSQLLTMGVVALNQAAQPILGYSCGSGRVDLQGRCLGLSLLLGSVLSLLGFFLVQGFPERLLSLFSSSGFSGFPFWSVQAVRLYFALFFFSGLQIVAVGYFQSVGRVWLSALLSVSQRLLFFVPFLYVLPARFGLFGVWVSPVVAEGVTLILSVFLLVHEGRRLRRAVRADEGGDQLGDHPLVGL